MKCPNCGIDHTRLTDHMPLELPDKEDCQKNSYPFFDNEMYASWVCDNCGSKGGVKGIITWNKPTIIQ